MLSRADGPTVPARPVERAARVLGVLGLLVVFAQSVWPLWRPASTNSSAARVEIGSTPDSASASRLATQLVSHLATAATPRSLHVTLATLPSAAERATLSALVDAGMPVRRRDVWREASGLRSLSLSLTMPPAPRPTALLEVSVRTARETSGTLALRVRDAAGLIDSLAIARGDTSIAMRLGRLSGPVSVELVRDGGVVATASAAVPRAPIVRAVRVYARPGWESKFTTAALEESGWQVDGTVRLAPTARVQVGSAAANAASLDTVRHSAAIVLDSGVVSLRELQRFLAQGGGVMFAGEALKDVALQAVIPSTIALERPAIAGALLTADPLRGIPAFVLRARGGAVVLAREDAHATMVVQRLGTARVLASGYRDLWHWRMEGLDESSGLHRRWWNDAVSTIAFSPASDSVAPSMSRWPGAAAPVADLLARVGAEDTATAPVVAASGVRVPLWAWLVLATLALLTEWTLRRLRGAP